MHELISHPGYFTSLPREYYVSDEIYALEEERVFPAQWLYAAHISELRDPGDFVVKDIGSESVIVTRSESGAVNAFFNVCRHRGSRVCDGRRGNSKRLVCPYHGWTYDLDGRVVAVPAARDGEYFDYADWGLVAAHVELWRGLVFVNLSEKVPASLADSFAGYEAEFDLVQPERCKVVHQEAYEVAANWKLAVENFVECYHCPGAHPEFSRVCDVRELYRRDLTASPGDGAQHRRVALPLRGGMQSLTIDGRFVSSKLLGQFGESDEPPVDFSTAFQLLPNVSVALFFVDYGITFEIRPLSVDRTRLASQWLVHEDAQEGRDFELQSLIELWDVTNRQDVVLVERNQAGVSSRRFTPGPNSAAREPGISEFLTTYLDLMQG